MISVTGAIFDKVSLRTTLKIAVTDFTQFGIWTLQPLAIALIAFDGLIWQMLPKEKTRPQIIKQIHI